MLELVVAQALIERGLLDSMAAGLTSLRYQVEAYVGQGRSTYIVIGVLVLIAVALVRRRR